MITKECPICGNAFTTNNYRAKYCSPDCKKQGRLITREKWFNNHPDYMKDWRESHPDYSRNWKATHPHYERDRSRARREKDRDKAIHQTVKE